MQEMEKVLGHEEVIKHLQNAAAMDKVSHSYIFAGEKGSGKTSPGRRGEAGRAGGKTETPQGKISRGKGKKSGNRKKKKEKRSGCS